MFKLKKIVRSVLSFFGIVSSCGLNSCGLIYDDLSKCPSPEEQINLQAQFIINLKVDTSMRNYQEIVTDFSSRNSEGWNLKYWVAVYRYGEKDPFLWQPTTETSVSLSLPVGEYNFVAWAEPVPDFDGNTVYFHTDDFSEMLQKNKYSYKGNDVRKTPYRGITSQLIVLTTKEVNVNLKPAYARLNILATDKDDVTFNPDKIVISYYNIPGAIHALTGEINLKWGDVGFTSYANQDLLAFDHILSHDTQETSVSLKVEIYDDENKLKAKVDPITVPLINGGVTTVKGNFYSMLVHQDEIPSGPAGGVTIDPEWEGTIYIEY